MSSFVAGDPPSCPRRGGAGAAASWSRAVRPRGDEVGPVHDERAIQEPGPQPVLLGRTHPDGDRLGRGDAAPLPWRIWAFLERRLSISVEIPDRDPAFRWVQAWLADQRYARRARDLSLTTLWITRDLGARRHRSEAETPTRLARLEARFLLAPAPGDAPTVLSSPAPDLVPDPPGAAEGPAAGVSGVADAPAPGRQPIDDPGHPR